MSDLINLRQPSWGQLYQGTPIEQNLDELATLPKPLLLVYMDLAPVIRIDHQRGVHVELHVAIDDSPDACLPDGVLVGLAAGLASSLRSGVNVRVQCGASISRSSYMSCATIMTALGVGFEPALAILRTDHAIANPNSGFVAHLRRLEPVLSGVGA